MGSSGELNGGTNDANIEDMGRSEPELSRYSSPSRAARGHKARLAHQEKMAFLELTELRGGYVIGTYTGNGMTYDQGGQQIDLEFRPQAVIISKQVNEENPERPSTTLAIDNVSIYSNNANYIANKRLEINNNGFIVYNDSRWRLSNGADELYVYIAFK